MASALPTKFKPTRRYLIGFVGGLWINPCDRPVALTSVTGQIVAQPTDGSGTGTRHHRHGSTRSNWVEAVPVA